VGAAATIESASSLADRGSRLEACRYERHDVSPWGGRPCAISVIVSTGSSPGSRRGSSEQPRPGVATLVPERRKARRVSWPDFLARLRTDWPRGLKGKSIGELIAEERAGAGRRRAGIATGQAAPGYRRRRRSSSAVVLQWNGAPRACSA